MYINCLCSSEFDMEPFSYSRMKFRRVLHVFRRLAFSILMVCCVLYLGECMMSLLLDVLSASEQAFLVVCISRAV